MPPGPFAWPVVGSFPALAAGSVPTIVVSIAAIAEELFQQHNGNFLDRPKMMAHHILTSRQLNVVSFSGLYWRKLQKFYIYELFTQASYQGIRTDEIKTSIKEIIADSKQGKLINMKDWLQGVTSNNMTQMLVNKRYFGRKNNNTKEKEEFRFIICSLFDILGASLINDYVPYLGFISKLQGWETRFEKPRVLMHDIMERMFKIQITSNKSKQEQTTQRMCQTL